MRIWIFVFAGILFFGCKNYSISSIELRDLKGNKGHPEDIKNDAFALYFFLSPQCPLSENYTSIINDINSYIDSTNANILTYIVFPGMHYSNDEIVQFVYRFKLKPQVFLDPSKELTEILGATITPEVFLINDQEEIIYQGAIDNWIIDLGTKRQIVSDHYLLDVIDALMKNEKIEINKTEAVGCFIE